MSLLTKYVCTKCGATDSDHSERPPQALNCWKCGAGRGIPSVGEMIQSGVGMFPEAMIDPSVLKEVGRRK